MSKKNTRPYVICHMLSALDGKISGNYFSVPELIPVRNEMGKIRERYNCDAVLYGAVTAAEIYADGYVADLEKTEVKYDRKDSVVAADAGKYVVSVDIEGKLKWSSGYAERSGRPKSHIIEVLTENVSDDYLALLQKAGVSYIFAGKEKLEIELALMKLKTLFHIEKLMIAGGGIINWSFLQAGCIDELSLVLCPLADGRTDTASLFDRSSYLKTNEMASFLLTDVQKLEGDGLWLKYKPKNIL